MAMRSKLLAMLAAAGMAMSAYAQSPGTKTAVISFQSALVGTKDGQKAAQELESKFAPKRKELNDRQAELTSLNDQLRKGSNTMSQEAQAQLEREIQSKNTRLQRDTQDAQDEWNAEQQRLLQGLGQRMIAVIDKYAKDNGYSVVMDNSSPNTPILYSSTAIDITQDIISLYDKTSSNGGPAVVPQTPSSSGPGTPKPATPKPLTPGGMASPNR
jgi:outer membrane protein